MDVYSRVAFISARNEDVAGAAGLQVDITTSIFPALVHQGDDGALFHIGHHSGIDWTDPSAVSDDICRTYVPCVLGAYELNSVGDSCGPCQFNALLIGLLICTIIPFLTYRIYICPLH